MQTYLKTKPVWIQLLLFIGMAFGILMAVSIIGVLVYSSITGVGFMELADPDKWDYNNSQTIVTIRFMQVLQFFGLFFIPVLLFAYFSDPAPMQYLGLNQPTKKRYWIIGIIIMIVAIPLVEYTGFLNQQFSFSAETQQWIKSKEEAANKMIQYMLGRRTPVELFLNIIFIAVTAAVGEELFFRGVLQRIFIKIFKNPWAGIIITAILFSALHMQFLGFIPRMLMGILLGAIYWYSGSLWVSIFAHFFYDALIITIFYFRPDIAKTEATQYDPSNLLIAALISAALVGILLWQMIKHSSARYADVYSNDKPGAKDEFSF